MREREQRGRAARADTGSCGAIALQRKCDTFPAVSFGDERAATSQEGRRERGAAVTDGARQTDVNAPSPRSPRTYPSYTCAPLRLHLPRLSTARPRPSELPSPRVHTYSLPEVNARLPSPFVTGGTAEAEKRALGKAADSSINQSHVRQTFTPLAPV